MNVAIISNTLWADKHGFISLHAPEFVKLYKPGQLCMLSVSHTGATDPLLGRPFAPFSTEGDTVGILYAVVGRGTDMLSKQPAGGKLFLSIPHGKPFKQLKSKNVALIAGGVGLAPMNALAKVLYNNGCSVDIYYGGRSSADIYPPVKEGTSPYNWIFTTEDGSFGNKGLVTEFFKNNIEKYDMCYTCGPKGMMRAVHDVCAQFSKPLEVSLEEVMACGIGVCGGCMVDIKENGTIVRKRCCTEGPVFESNLVF